MTRDAWDREWLACLNRLKNKGYNDSQARTMAWAITGARYGQRPEGPPFWLKIALKIVGRKLQGLETQEGTMGQRILAAAVYGLLGIVGALQISGIPKDQQGWLGIIGVFITAFWGKFSSNQTLVAPNRPVWTDADRAKGGPNEQPPVPPVGPTP